MIIYIGLVYTVNRDSFYVCPYSMDLGLIILFGTANPDRQVVGM